MQSIQLFNLHYQLVRPIRLRPYTAVTAVQLFFAKLGASLYSFSSEVTGLYFSCWSFSFPYQKDCIEHYSEASTLSLVSYPGQQLYLDSVIADSLDKSPSTFRLSSSMPAAS